MPELPEVETVRLQLMKAVVGKTISAVDVYAEKTVGFDAAFAKKLVGQKIAHIDRVGKLLIFSFVGEPDLFLLGHLKMTGQFFFVDKKGGVQGGGHSLAAGDTKTFPGKHTRVAVRFSDGSALYFNDMRRFGYTKLADSATLAAIKATYGPEPHQATFDVDRFRDSLKRRHRAIKAVLLDQSFIAGLGNIYVDEALWRAKVRPDRSADAVRPKEAAALAEAAGAVLRESIAVGGTTFRDFAHTNGEAGNFTDYLAVFAKEGQACGRCGTTIVKTRVAGRGTHFCPRCQR